MHSTAGSGNGLDGKDGAGHPEPFEKGACRGIRMYCHQPLVIAMPTFEVDTDRPGSAGTVFGDSEVTPELILEAIQDVVADVGAFLSDWVQRVDQRAAARCKQVTPDALLREQMEEFQSMKSYWEAKRTAEEQRLKEKADQLTAAWIRLEDEQRAILQTRESQGGSIRDRSIAPQTATVAKQAVASGTVAAPQTAAAANQAIVPPTAAAAAQQQPHPVAQQQPQPVAQQQPAAPATGHPGARVQYQQPSQLNPDYPAASDVAQWNQQLAAESGFEYSTRRQISVGGEMGGHVDTVGRVDAAAELGQSQAGTAVVSSSRESAVRQFQRLRREIDASRSNSPQS